MLTSYKVSTITANGCVGVPLSLDPLFINLRVLPTTDKTSRGFIFAEYKIGVQVMTRGANPRAKSPRRVKGAPSAPAPAPAPPVAPAPAQAPPAAAGARDTVFTDGSGMQRFINQITAVYRMSDTQTPNVKIFYNGNLQITGIKRVEDGEELVDRIVEEFRRCGSAVCADPSALQSRDFTVRMINANFEAPFFVSRNRMFDVLKRETALQIMFEANTYQALKLHYYFNDFNPGQCGCCLCNSAAGGMLCEGKGVGKVKWDCKRVTLAVFETGRMLISGATKMEHVDCLHRFMEEFFQKHSARFRHEALAARAAVVPAAPAAPATQAPAPAQEVA